VENSSPSAGQTTLHRSDEQGFPPKQGMTWKGMAGVVIGTVTGAAASVACFQTGYFVFFFLVPLAIVAFLKGAKAGWAAGILSAAVNSIVSLGC
jgi:hypothetical protein